MFMVMAENCIQGRVRHADDRNRYVRASVAGSYTSSTITVADVAFSLAGTTALRSRGTRLRSPSSPSIPRKPQRPSGDVDVVVVVVVDVSDGTEPFAFAPFAVVASLVLPPALPLPVPDAFAPFASVLLEPLIVPGVVFVVPVASVFADPFVPEFVAAPVFPDEVAAPEVPVCA